MFLARRWHVRSVEQTILRAGEKMPKHTMQWIYRTRTSTTKSSLNRSLVISKTGDQNSLVDHCNPPCCCLYRDLFLCCSLSVARKRSNHVATQRQPRIKRTVRVSQRHVL